MARFILLLALVSCTAEPEDAIADVYASGCSYAGADGKRWPEWVARLWCEDDGSCAIGHAVVCE